MARYKVHTFLTSNSFVIDSVTGKLALDTVEYLVVAGGGSAAGNHGGGGGAGGFRTGNISITANTYTIVVGAGGAGTSGVVVGNDGTSSTFYNIISAGGGGSGGYSNPQNAAVQNGRSGGSGGGGGVGHSYTITGTGGAGNTPSTSPSQGNNGGAAAPTGTLVEAGGGGGAGAAGANAVSSVSGGNGGIGITSFISGSSVTYAGGGGGSIVPAGTLGVGGAGGGGNASYGTGASGTENTGGGGGGGNSAGGAGGSGIVIIRYPVINAAEIVQSKISRVSSVIKAANAVYETEEATITVNTVSASNGEVLYYTTSGNADVYANAQGQFQLNNNTGSFTLITEGSVPDNEVRELIVQIRRNSNTGPILATTSVSVSPLIGDPAKLSSVDYLVVAGGGGAHRAGGGAGGLITGNISLTSPAIGISNVSIGAGGVGGAQSPFGTSASTRGGNTVISIVGAPFFAVGGGAGWHDTFGGTPGGSGGGLVSPSATVGYANVAGQGNFGGAGAFGGGGGGAGQAGQGSPANQVGGNGGNGLPITWMTGWFGESNPFSESPGRWFAGGGGNRGNPTYLAGKGGWGGGGPGGRAEGTGSQAPGGAGNVNTGGGGGGSEAGWAQGMSGGSGIFVLRYPTSARMTITGGNVIVENGSKFHVFTNSGNLNISSLDLFNGKASLVRTVTGSSAFANTAVSVSVTSLNAANGEIMYYSTSGISEFQGANTGSFLLFGNANASISVTPAVTGNLVVQIRRNSSEGSILKESSTISINPPPLYLLAEGGTITDSGGYRIHSFTTSANLEITSLASPSAYNTLDYLIVAGGGGGGSTGGGGAGGLLSGNITITGANTYIVIVGSGGSGINGGRTNGANSSVFSIVAVGGGSGGFGTGPGFGVPGGSGGGGSYYGRTGGTNVSGQGYSGGTGRPNSPYTGGGGGGANQEGFGGTVSGNGGHGAPSHITTANVIYAGGGGAGNNLGPEAQGLGGAGGGGRGAPGQPPSAWDAPTQIGTPGTINTGGGGGGGGASGFSDGGTGGSGIVIIRYPIA